MKKIVSVKFHFFHATFTQCDGRGGGAVCGHGAEYVTLLSQFLVQKSVMLGEKFNQLPKNVHGCTDALLKCGGGGWSR